MHKERIPIYAVATGGRDFPQKASYRSLAERWLSDVILQTYNIELLIVGAAKGWDTYMQIWAEDEGVDHIIIPPNWKKYPRAGGVIRNTRMLDQLLMFCNYKSLNLKEHCRILAGPGGKGTQDCKEQAESLGIEIIEFIP